MNASSSSFSSPAKPEAASSTRRQSSKKRVSRACDECRLHKARCDGAKNCETCFRYDRVCSYNLQPSESKGSAAKIRLLEHRLAKAKECIGDLQRQLPENAVFDFEQALAPQSAPNIPVVLSPSPDAASGQNLASPSASSPDTIARKFSLAESTTTTFAGTGFSLIESLLQPLSFNDKVLALINSGIARSILCDTGGANDDHPNPSRQLPPYDIMIEIIYAAFNNIFGLSNIVVEHEFRIVTQRLYDNDPNSYTSEDNDFIPLFCSVIALGMICSTSFHRTLEYEEALKQSHVYFETASLSIANDQEGASLVQLQTTLCLVLYLLNTSKLDLARPALRIICASPMVQGLFISVSTQTPGTQSLLNLRTKDLVWTIYYLDMHVSGLLGLSTLLPSPGPELATVHAINTAAHNIANYKRSDSTFLSSVSVAMAIELMKLIGRISLTTVVIVSRHGIPSPSSFDVPEWHDIRAKFETWEFMLQSIFPENDVNPALSLARHHLQCHLYLAQIMLYHGFLRQHSEPKPMKSPSDIDDINKGQACTAAATSAIMYISMYLQQTQATSLPFHSAHVLFIGLLTLMVAASFTDDSGRQSIQHTTRIGTNILSSTDYGSSRTKILYLEFIQGLSGNLDKQYKSKLNRRSSISSAASIFKSSIPLPITLSSQDSCSSTDGSSSNTNSSRSPPISNQSEKTRGRWDFDPS